MFERPGQLRGFLLDRGFELRVVLHDRFAVRSAHDLEGLDAGLRFKPERGRREIVSTGTINILSVPGNHERGRLDRTVRFAVVFPGVRRHGRKPGFHRN